MGPVLLLDMGVIVFMIGSASGKLHGLVSLVKVPHQMPIQEFRAVIGVKPKQRERQGGFDVLELPKDLCFPFAPDRSLFCPAGGNIHGVQGVDKITEETLPQWAMVSASRNPGLVSSHWLVLMGSVFSRGCRVWWWFFPGLCIWPGQALKAYPGWRVRSDGVLWPPLRRGYQILWHKREAREAEWPSDALSKAGWLPTRFSWGF